MKLQHSLYLFIFYILLGKTPIGEHHPIPENGETPNFSLSNITISPQDVKYAITILDVSKACGSDLISPRLLKEGINELSSPPSSYFSNSVKCSKFPDQWKKANVKPIFKKLIHLNPQITDQYLFLAVKAN